MASDSKFKTGCCRKLVGGLRDDEIRPAPQHGLLSQNSWIPSRYYAEILEQTELAETLGYHAVWFGEHQGRPASQDDLGTRQEPVTLFARPRRNWALGQLAICGRVHRACAGFISCRPEQAIYCGRICGAVT
jgi:hypothetical protein